MNYELVVTLPTGEVQIFDSMVADRISEILEMMQIIEEEIKEIQ